MERKSIEETNWADTSLYYYGLMAWSMKIGIIESIERSVLIYDLQLFAHFLTMLHTHVLAIPIEQSCLNTEGVLNIIRAYENVR
jgi:hypothetical protein